ncbi:MAG: GxxExxY protein [Candidatus Doudnabacteria bacterium]|nr:GxxExxY protein [Candidatus Doudnabacteria bacterium]
MEKIIEKELSYEITGLCYKVHKDLGRFCREKQYADELEGLLKENKIEYQRELEIKQLRPNSPAGNKVDFMIKKRIIVDIKAKKFITKEDYMQMQRYLQSANLELGLIVNFRSTYLKPQRVLNHNLFSDHSDANSDHSDRHLL